MRKEERASIARLLNDLIKADSIIDIGEMEMYARLKWQYKITKEDELAAFEMTIADAMNVLSNSSNDLRESLLNSFSEMTISDGFCARQEALLMLAFIYCMKETSRGLCAIYSVHEPDVQIDDCQVVYVESAYDTNINNDIKANYRSIDKEFRLVGFNFVYIPYIISHYKNTDVNLLKEITNFLAPTISEDKIEPLVEQLTGLTTANYCNEQLCNKLRLYTLRDMPPSFLIKINHTYVKEQLYMNFLRISIDDDVLPLVRRITDIYSNMLSSDTRLVKYSEEAFGQFMYHGFYKQLFDIYIIRKGTSSNVLFDFMKESISFMEISMEIKGLHRRDKALYALLIMESEDGGIDFTQPNNAKQKKIYERRMNEIQQKYNIIYQAFNGDRNSVPCLTNADIRRPMISNIRRCINNFSYILHNVNDYNICKNSFNHFCVNIPHINVYVNETGVNSKCIELHNTHIYNKIRML